MLDILRKTIMAGIGVGVQTRGKIEEVLNEWVEKGRMSSTEARELADRIMDAGKVEFERARRELGDSYEELLHKGNVVTQQQLQTLENRVQLLESQLAGHLAAGGETSRPDPEAPTPPSAGE